MLVLAFYFSPDAQQQAVATIYVFHDITRRYRKALHLQRVRQAVLRLQEAIAHLPEQLDFASPEGLFLLSPPVLLVTRQLVEVIGQVLDCQDVALWAFGPPARYLHYAAGSGFTWEQELCRREKSGHILLSEYVDETALARLSANQEVILPSKRLCPRYRERYSAENLLWIPILLENRLSGALVIAKAGADISVVLHWLVGKGDEYLERGGRDFSAEVQRKRIKFGLQIQ